MFSREMAAPSRAAGFFPAGLVPSLALWAAIAAAGLLALAPALVNGQETRIGYLLSKREGFATQDRAGATMGMEEINLQAAHLNMRFSLVFARGGKSQEVVAEAIRLIDREGARALMGSVSGAATVALARLAQVRDIVFFNIGSPVDSLRDKKCGLNTFSIAPSLTMRVQALGQWAIHGKEWKRWAVIEGDSRTEGRLSRAAQAYLAANGGEVAGVVSVNEETAYAPGAALAEIAGLGADFVFVALTGEKQTLVLGAYKASGATAPIGGAMPEGVRFDRNAAHAAGYWSVGWNHLQRRYGASELNNRFVDFTGTRMDERGWAAWAGVKILGEAILRAETTDAQTLVPYLRERLQFDGYQGVSMNFREWNHQLRQPMQIVQVNDKPGRNGWDTLVPAGRVPLRGLKGWKGDPVDSIGRTREQSRCKW